MIYAFICLAAHTDEEEKKSLECHTSIKITVLIVSLVYLGHMLSPIIPYLVPIASIMVVSYFVLVVILPTVGYVLSNIMRGPIMDEIYYSSVTTRDRTRDFVDELTSKYDKGEIQNTANMIYGTVDQFLNTLADYACDTES